MKLVSAIVKNTVPVEYLGVVMYNKIGVRPNFKKEGKKLIFQAAIKLDFMKKDDNSKLFEFITATNFEINKTIEDEGFYELLYSHIITAIKDFNRHIKTNKSYLTMDIRYPEDISFENAKEGIRKAWLMKNFTFQSNN